MSFRRDWRHGAVLASSADVVSDKTKGPKAAATASSASGKKKKKGGPIDKSLISGPVRFEAWWHPLASSANVDMCNPTLQAEGSFKHIAHMGYTAENGFASSGVDPSWQALLDSLGNKGISQKQILENEGFIRDFVGKQGGPPVSLSDRALTAQDVSLTNEATTPPARSAGKACAPKGAHLKT